MTELLASVIVPAHNARATLGACLQALLRQTLPPERYEIIVVDDGSTDGTDRVAAAFGVQVLRQPRKGPAAARNAGAAIARGTIVVFTDADCAPCPDWLERMLAPFADPTVVGVKGAYRSAQRALLPRFIQAEYEDKYDRLRQCDRIAFVDGYAAAYRRAIFLAEGGFDPVFPVPSAEDIEFSFRLARRGHRLVFAPEARVYHQHAIALRHYLRRKFRYGYWRLLVYRRYPERALDDGHTPTSLKLQVGLAPLLALSLALSPFTRHGWRVSGLLGLAFLASTGPFVRKTHRRDPGAALVAPGLMFLRGLALAAGLGAGLLRLAADCFTGRRPEEAPG